MQTEDAVAAEAVEYAPTHNVQFVAPYAVEYEPAPQLLQTDVVSAPNAVEKKPVPQSVHEEAEAKPVPVK